jgi:hypothetical protein
MHEIQVHAHIYIYIYIHTHTQTHTHTYIYTHTYTHTHTHTHLYSPGHRRSWGLWDISAWKSRVGWCNSAGTLIIWVLNNHRRRRILFQVRMHLWWQGRRRLLGDWSGCSDHLGSSQCIFSGSGRCLRRILIHRKLCSGCVRIQRVSSWIVMLLPVFWGWSVIFFEFWCAWCASHRVGLSVGRGENAAWICVVLHVRVTASLPRRPRYAQRWALVVFSFWKLAFAWVVGLHAWRTVFLVAQITSVELFTWSDWGMPARVHYDVCCGCAGRRVFVLHMLLSVGACVMACRLRGCRWCMGLNTMRDRGRVFCTGIVMMMMTTWALLRLREFVCVCDEVASTRARGCGGRLFRGLIWLGWASWRGMTSFRRRWVNLRPRWWVCRLIDLHRSVLDTSSRCK